MSNPARAVVITGASTGIGRACAEHLDGHGWRVFAGVRKAADADAISAAGSDRLTPLTLDVCDSASISAAAEQVRAELGDAGLHGLVNNAGVAIGGPMEFIPMDDLRRQFEVNYFGLVATTQAFLPALREATGRVVNISSMGGRLATPFYGPYCSTKFAVEAVSDCLRRELAPWGMRVVVVQPGSVATPIWDKGRAQADRADDTLPALAQELYAKQLAGLPAKIQETAARGIPPLRVAEAVAHGLTSRKPRLRYAVGLDSRIGQWVNKWLGDRAMDWVMNRQFGAS